MPKNTKIFLVVIAVMAAFMLGTLFSQSPRTPQAPNMTQNAMQGTSPNTPNTTSATPKDSFAANNNELQHVKELEAQALKEPANAKLFADIGNHYYDQNMPKESIIAYNKSLAIEPNNPDVLTDLGTMYRLEKDFAKATESYLKALDINSSHRNARFNIGLVYITDLNEVSKGVEAWQTLYAQYPDEQINGVDFDLFVLDILEKQALYYASKNDIDLAVKYYDALIGINPRDQIILTDKAMLLQKNNKIDEARSAWLELLKVNPDASTLDGMPVKSLEIIQN